VLVLDERSRLNHSCLSVRVNVILNN
jgi:hypothetical protein